MAGWRDGGTPGRRLTALLAAISALELAVGAGLPARWVEAVGYPRGWPAWRYFVSFREMAAALVGPLVSIFFFPVVTLAVLAYALRVTRGALPGSARDPVIALRDFFRRRRLVTRLVPWLPALLLTRMVGIALTAEHAWRSPAWFLPMYVGRALALVVASGLVALLGRQLLRTLAQLPDATASEIEMAQAASLDRDETTFLAVAVTARTKASVLLMSVLTAGLVTTAALATRLSIHDAGTALGLSGYGAALLAWAAWFRKASTIAVGRDGVLVRGTSKERFFAYGSSFDEVRLHGISLDLVRAGARVIRLQLHGPDAARAGSLTGRIRSALAASTRTDGVHLLARAAAGNSLGRAAAGATDYRQPSINREQLWELVEGEATDEQARIAAARALAGSCDRNERGRLRIAATHVADPRVRIALDELADDEGGAVASPSLLAASPLARIGS